MKPDQLDVARLRKAFASAEGEGTHSVDSERVFDALHGDLSVQDRRAVVDELIADADAAEAWRLAMDIILCVFASSVAVLVLQASHRLLAI